MVRKKERESERLEQYRSMGGKKEKKEHKISALIFPQNAFDML